MQNLKKQKKELHTKMRINKSSADDTNTSSVDDVSDETKINIETR